MSDLIHGIELVELSEGVRTITTARASVIGLVCTAPEASDSGDLAFPLNTPVLVTSAKQARKLIYNDATGTGDDGGTAIDAIDAIANFANAVIVMVRVAEGADEDETATNAAGSSSARTGVWALLNAESATSVPPRILLAPGIKQFSKPDTTWIVSGVPTALLGVAARLRGFALLDGPNVDVAATTACEALVTGERGRAYMIDPWVTIDGATKPPSASVAGLIVLSDQERGWWWSPSNRPMLGVTGTSRPIDFAIGDSSCEADILNGNHIATIIRSDGFRLWGNRTLDKVDARWKFLSSRRIADMICDALQRNHLWAMDQNITTGFFEAVLGGVNNYMRYLQSIGAIYGGKCYIDAELNTDSEVAAGHTYFDFDFSQVFPNEKMTFRAHMVNDYITEIIPV
jgi:phage tail sheath protein FI